MQTIRLSESETLFNTRIRCEFYEKTAANWICLSRLSRSLTEGDFN